MATAAAAQLSSFAKFACPSRHPISQLLLPFSTYTHTQTTPLSSRSIFLPCPSPFFFLSPASILYSSFSFTSVRFYSLPILAKHYITLLFSKTLSLSLSFHITAAAAAVVPYLLLLLFFYSRIVVVGTQPPSPIPALVPSSVYTKLCDYAPFPPSPPPPPPSVPNAQGAESVARTFAHGNGEEMAHTRALARSLALLLYTLIYSIVAVRAIALSSLTGRVIEGRREGVHP